MQAGGRRFESARLHEEPRPTAGERLPCPTDRASDLAEGAPPSAVCGRPHGLSCRSIDPCAEMGRRRDVPGAGCAPHFEPHALLDHLEARCAQGRVDHGWRDGHDRQDRGDLGGRFTVSTLQRCQRMDAIAPRRRARRCRQRADDLEPGNRRRIARPLRRGPPAPDERSRTRPSSVLRHVRRANPWRAGRGATDPIPGESAWWGSGLG